MSDASWIAPLGLAASILLPLFNIPLMARLVRRRSSADVSLVWAVGIWSCLVAIEPAAIASGNFLFQVNSTLNLIIFTGVLGVTVHFRRHPARNNPMAAVPPVDRVTEL